MDGLSADAYADGELSLGDVSVVEVLTEAHPAMLTNPVRQVNSAGRDALPYWLWQDAQDRRPNPGMPNRIRELRAARNLTMAQLAELADTSEQTISRIERGIRQLTDNWIRRIANALDVHPFELLVPDIQDPHSTPKDLQDIEILRVWRRLNEDERRVVARFMEALTSDPNRIDPRCPYDTERRRA